MDVWNLLLCISYRRGHFNRYDCRLLISSWWNRLKAIRFYMVDDSSNFFTTRTLARRFGMKWGFSRIPDIPPYEDSES